MQIRVQPLSGSRLAQDYLRGTAQAMPFYPGSPSDLDSFRRKRDEVRTRFGREERARAAAALRPTSERARERLARFVEEGGAVVTTGQQAGLLTGPLYTIYKALTAARLAETLEAELGTLVLPVFWNASEDHDWAEVNHVHVAGKDGGVRRIELRSPDERALPMSDRVLGEGVRSFLDEVYHLVGGEVHAPTVLNSIRDAYSAERTVAEAFSGLLHDLLAPFDFLLTDAAHPELKRASAAVVARALSGAERHERLLRERSDALLEAGYHAQVPVLDGATNVFYHGTGERERLYRSGGGFGTRESGARLDAAGALAQIDGAPEMFSPNVFLRPVVESFVFPTLAYVGGPGEISYFAQLGVLFPEYGIEPPVVFPRASFTLVEPAIGHLLRKLEIPFEELDRPRHELAGRIARAAMPPEVRAALDALGAAIAGGYGRLMRASEPIDPTLSGTLGAIRNGSLSELAVAERKVLGRIREREEIALSQLDRARGHLFPLGEPQERVLNAVPYLARYGPSLLGELKAAIPLAWEAPVP